MELARRFEINCKISRGEAILSRRREQLHCFDSRRLATWLVGGDSLLHDAATRDLLEDARRQGYDFQLLEKPVQPSTMLSLVALEAQSEISSPTPVLQASPLLTETS